MCSSDLYFNLEKYNEAIDYYKKASKSESNLILEGAYSGLAVCYEFQNNFNEAIKSYESALENSTSIDSKGKYQYFIALCYEKLGEKDKAEKLFREILITNKSEFVSQAKIGLIRLGTEIE